MEILKANANDAGQRLDKFLSKRYKSMPQSLLYKYIRTKRIKLNGKRAKENRLLADGDEITLYIPGDTLIDHIKAYLYRNGEYDPTAENSFAPALCNRIDRNTAGLVIAAKNAEALRDMNATIRDRGISKLYLAACHGFFEKKQGIMTAYLEKNAAENKVFVRTKAGENTKTAALRYRVIDENRAEKLSLVEIELLTGRTHQIRVQMADSGHPLLGDGKYAVNKDDRKRGYTYQALCSYMLAFEKPQGSLSYLTGKTVRADKPDFLVKFGAK